VRVRVSSVNDAGESPLSDAVEITVPRETPGFTGDRQNARLLFIFGRAGGLGVSPGRKPGDDVDLCWCLQNSVTKAVSRPLRVGSDLKNGRANLRPGQQTSRLPDFEPVKCSRRVHWIREALHWRQQIRSAGQRRKWF
jgi:hypothetical protein